MHIWYISVGENIIIFEQSTQIRIIEEYNDPHPSIKLKSRHDLGNVESWSLSGHSDPGDENCLQNGRVT